MLLTSWLVGRTAPVRGAAGVTGAVAEIGKPHLVGGDEVMSNPPSPKEDLRVQVTLAVAYDSTSRLYTYAYTVLNQNQSGNSMDSFGVTPVPKPIDIRSPAHWKGFYGWEDDTKAVVWTVWDSGGVKMPVDTTQTFDVTASPYELAHGSSLDGFVIVSRQPPTANGAPITWYAQGFDTLTDLSDERDEGNTPSQDSFFIQSVNGPIAGPDINSTVSVGSGGPSWNAPELRQPTPNPSPGGVSIGYVLPTRSEVLLAIYDVAGRRLATLSRGPQQPGIHFATWTGILDAGGTARPGVYFTRLVVNGSQVGQRRLTILR